MSKPKQMHVEQDEVSVKFQIGKIVTTRHALDTIPYLDWLDALARHARGYWGDVCEEDRLANEEALVIGGRLFSVYHSEEGLKFWIITECDRSVTTILLPEDY